MDIFKFFTYGNETSTFEELRHSGEELDTTCVTVNGALYKEAVSGTS